MVSYRLRLRVAVPKYEPREEAAPSKPRPPQAKGRRTIDLQGTGTCEAALYERDRLDIGAVIDGPAIVEQFDATTVIPPGWGAEVDRRHNLVLEKRGG